jgi:hypothetical protein
MLLGSLHDRHLLKIQSRFTGGGGERGHAAVILQTRGVEHDRVDAFGLGALGDRLTESSITNA